MSNANEDRTKISPAPDSTWGASEEAKEAWDRKFGEPRRKQAEREKKEDKD
jgi:hypothetical protein